MYVFSDSTIYLKHADPEIEKMRFAIRNAISAAKNTSTSIGIPFSNEVISAPAYPAVCDALTGIHRQTSRRTVHLRSVGRVKTALHGAPCPCPVGERRDPIGIR